MEFECLTHHHQQQQQQRQQQQQKQKQHHQQNQRYRTVHHHQQQQQQQQQQEKHKSQQQQQLKHKLDSMATGSSTNSSSNTNSNNSSNSSSTSNSITTITSQQSAATNSASCNHITSSGGSSNNNNNNIVNSNNNNTSIIISNNNNNNNNNNNTNKYLGIDSAASSCASSLRTADAATVAIAKDMLQLHHGGAMLNNSTNNSNSGNSISVTSTGTSTSNNNTVVTYSSSNSSSSNTNNNLANADCFNATQSSAASPPAGPNPPASGLDGVATATPAVVVSTSYTANNPPAHLNSNNNTAIANSNNNCNSSNNTALVSSSSAPAASSGAGGCSAAADPTSVQAATAALPSPASLTAPGTLSAAQATTGTAVQSASPDSTVGHLARKPPPHALGYLKVDDEILYITEPCTIIGRNSSSSHVHFHVAESNLVSRKHFQVLYDMPSRDFLVQCLSKNGIFVNEFLQRRNLEPYRLPQQCFFRFPSTAIRILFKSFVHPSLFSGNNGASAIGGVAIPNMANEHYMNSGGALGGSNNNGQPGEPGGGGGGGGGGVAGLGSGDATSNVVVNVIGDGRSTPTANLIALGQGGNVVNSPTIDVEHTPPHPHPYQRQVQGHSKHQQQQQQQQQQYSTAAGASVVASHLLPMDSANAICSPLKIQIPKKEQKSPYLSPTGTISAANSCPASPRQGFHQNQAAYNNYSNNNLQNQDLFQTPSTASYSHNEKPPYSYAQLIVQAISAAPDKQLTLSGIYSFIVKHYPYYRKETNKGWQNSIRHNLSLNRYFIKVARSQDEPGKGSFWRIDPDSGAKLIDHSYKKRRQRSSQGFRPSYGMPRSAPVSPSHIEYVADNSRESSPLQDIVLQSAPGSPGISIENRSAENDLIYTSQNMHQTISNNSHNQYNNSNSYFITTPGAGSITMSGGGGQQQQQTGGGLHESNANSGGGGGGGPATLMAAGHKRNHANAVGSTAAGNTITIGHHHLQQQQQQQQQQHVHNDLIYEELPTDYSGNGESGDECDSAKRSKYLAEML